MLFENIFSSLTFDERAGLKEKEKEKGKAITNNNCWMKLE